MNDLIVAEIAIRRDSEGRYCLNDLHRASGGADKDRPTYWLKLDQTIDLIKEIEIDGFPSIVSKQGLGTFVVKDLVYAYAMWIDVRFHLRVIRAYDTLVAQPPQPVQFTLEQAPEAALTAERERVRLQAQIEADRPKVDFHDEVARAEGDLLIREAAKVLFGGESGAERRLVQWMLDHRWLTKTGGTREPTAWAIQRRYMAQRLDVIRGIAYRVAMVRPPGLVYLRHLIRTGDLFTGQIQPERLLAATPHEHQ